MMSSLNDKLRWRKRHAAIKADPIRLAKEQARRAASRKKVKPADKPEPPAADALDLAQTHVRHGPFAQLFALQAA
jgi:hypothetical protein